MFGKELVNFCKTENYTIADKVLCNNSSFTFYNEAHKSVSWLDHFVVSNNLMGSINDVTIENGFVTSDHFPISTVFDMSCIKLDCTNYGPMFTKINWDKLWKNDLHHYKHITEIA